MINRAKNMSKNLRTENNPFFLQDGGRAMISLGPLRQEKSCPYSCAFCYVQDDFSSYLNYSISDIILFLRRNKDKYNIVYISGDTDSFAPPRREQGLELLSRVADEVSCDVLFATRSIFDDQSYSIIKAVNDNQLAKGYRLFAGTSITRLSPDLSYLEPFPVPTPDERIKNLINLKKCGAVTMLGLRPFLPVVPVSDYEAILKQLVGYLDIALGECFYFIRNGKIQSRVFPCGISADIEQRITTGHKMDFDDNNSIWDVWDSSEYESRARAICNELGIVFSMRSSDGIRRYLNNER